MQIVEPTSRRVFRIFWAYLWRRSLFGILAFVAFSYLLSRFADHTLPQLSMTTFESITHLAVALVVSILSFWLVTQKRFQGTRLALSRPVLRVWWSWTWRVLSIILPLLALVIAGLCLVEFESLFILAGSCLAYFVALFYVGFIILKRMLQGKHGDLGIQIVASKEMSS